MAKRTKANSSVYISAEVLDWMKEEEMNISETVGEHLEELYNNRVNPIIKINKLEREYNKIGEQLEFFHQKLQRMVEEGNKQEREEAERLIKEKEDKEREYQQSFVNLLEELRKHSDWEGFVDNYDEKDYKSIITYDEVFNRDGIETGGWGKLKELMRTFSKEQLKGGVILLEQESVGDAIKKE